MLTRFYPRLFPARFALLASRKCHKITARVRVCPLRIPLRPYLTLAVSLLLGTLNVVPLSARGQTTPPETTATSSGTEPSLSAGGVSRPSRDVQVVTNGNPANENFRRFRYNFGVTVREVYDDNIDISSIQRRSDFYTVLEPGIHLGFGDSEGGFNYLAFDYIASAYFFAEHGDRNAVEHLIHLAAQHDFGHLILGLSQDVRILDGTNLNSLSNTRACRQIRTLAARRGSILIPLLSTAVTI
jgi:hypothetical protein